MAAQKCSGESGKVRMKEERKQDISLNQWPKRKANYHHITCCLWCPKTQASTCGPHFLIQKGEKEIKIINVTVLGLPSSWPLKIHRFFSGVCGGGGGEGGELQGLQLHLPRSLKSRCVKIPSLHRMFHESILSSFQLEKLSAVWQLKLKTGKL